MPSRPEEPKDPFAELRQGLDDEPLGAPAAPRPSSPPSAAPPASAPPPLPRRPPSIPGAATRSSPGQVIPLPPAAPRPPDDADPFAEPSEPRPPRGGPEEKLDYFRQLLKQKTETLTRARTLYGERDAEALALREAGTTLQKALEDALAQLSKLRELPAKLEAERAHGDEERARADNAETRVVETSRALQLSEADRKDLSRALAEVEAQVPPMREALEEERGSRAALAEELVGAKEALQLAQDRLAELASLQSEAQGNLEALNEQYQAVAAENTRLDQERELAQEEARTLAAERDAALAERDAIKEESTLLEGRTRELEGTSAQGRSQIAKVEQELDREVAARSELQAGFNLKLQELQGLQNKLIATEERLAKAVSMLNEARTRLESVAGERDNAVATAKKGDATRTELHQEAGALRAQLGQAQAEMEERVTALEREYTQQAKKAKAAMDELGREREKGQALAREKAELLRQLDVERGAKDSLAQTAASAQAAAEEAARDVSAARDEAERVRSGPEGAATVKKLREELVVANRKAMEATAALQREKRLREEGASERPSTAGATTGSSEEVARLKRESDGLRGEVASLKKKLISAESAREAAASLKSKVAKLEAQLKSKA